MRAPEGTAALFPFARWVVAFLSLREGPCFPERSAKKFLSVGKLSGDFTLPTRARTSPDFLGRSSWSYAGQVVTSVCFQR